ncbi:hypothetical protein LKE08_14090, partial [Lyngbya sp. CCY1209]|nr:hypothetical protein [Lyngbya sp. CCY1209]
FAAATNTIYLSQELVDENSGNVNAIASVLLEEYGHYIDAEMNAIDSPGDEGDIFANLVVGQGLSESELLALWGEDDSAIVVLGGEEVAIEQANVSWLGGSGDWYNPRKWSGGKVPNSSDNVTVEAIGESVKINFSKGNPNIQDLFLAAKGGGSLSLNGLTTLGNDTDILAEGNKSIVKLPNLKTFSGKDVSSPSYIMVKDGGEVEAKKLTALKEVDLYATNSQLNLSGIKTFSGTTDT